MTKYVEKKTPFYTFDHSDFDEKEFAELVNELGDYGDHDYDQTKGESEMLKDLFRKKLSYTKEMKEQDLLWENESEDFDVMEKLFHQIVNEAKEKGFKGHVLIYKTDIEVVAEVFESKDQYEKAIDGLFDGYYDSTSKCKTLIELLEKQLR